MGKIALLFAGQGSQYPGMGRDFYENCPQSKIIFDTLDKQRSGTLQQCINGTREELSITINTQPCMFAVDYIIAKAVQEQGITIDAVAGFSLGEIPALAFAEFLNLEEAFDLVCYRAEAMNHAAENKPGGMQAILKLKADIVISLTNQFTEVFPVNYNSPEQTVVAGNPEQLKEFAGIVKTIGGRVVPLAVSGAFHSPYMDKAAEKMKKKVQMLTIHTGIIPVYANFHAQPYTIHSAKDLLSNQINHPVQWVNTITQMIADGIDCFIEVGPGKTLSGLVKKINTDVAVCHVEHVEDLAALQKEFQ